MKFNTEFSFRKMNSVIEALRNCHLINGLGPVPRSDPRFGCKRVGYLESYLINLHVYETVPKTQIRTWYREYPIEKLWSFGDLVMIDHQILPDTQVHYKRRIYSFFNDSVMTSDIKLLNFMIHGDQYDTATEMSEGDTYRYTDEDMYNALVRYINRNKLL